MSGIYPDILKIAKTIRLHKSETELKHKQSKTDICIVYLKQFNLITTFQFGFRKNHSINAVVGKLLSKSN